MRMRSEQLNGAFDGGETIWAGNVAVLLFGVRGGLLEREDDLSRPLLEDGISASAFDASFNIPALY